MSCSRLDSRRLRRCPAKGIGTVSPAPPDNTPPAPLIISPSTHDGVTPFMVGVNWNEPVTGFTVGDIVTGGPVTLGTLSGGPTNFTVPATPFLEDNITFDIPSGVAQDLAGNLSLAAAQVTVIDPPTVTITVPATHNTTTTFFAQFDFDQPVTGFDISDIVIVGGTLASFVGGSPGVTYTVQVTPTHTGNITIDVPAGVAIDGDSNGNLAAAQAVITPVDTQRPSVTIAPDVPTHDGSTPYNILFTWSESPILGFDVTDITITNATLSGFTQLTPTTWTVVSTPINPSTTIFTTVPSGSTTDTAGNQNLTGGPNVLSYSP